MISAQVGTLPIPPIRERDDRREARVHERRHEAEVQVDGQQEHSLDGRPAQSHAHPEQILLHYRTLLH